MTEGTHEIYHPGPGKMAQVYPRGTRELHTPKLCWCKPTFQFSLQQGSFAGAVVHR